ncbi:hypothetical protein F5Y10DRAFT_248074 [Nemania abortiva]|nr:hypothetical protein F5Y10DRAFT_248074 [Nemania abortiva]
MPYYATSQEWLRQSTLLLEARPSTTRITTTYHLTDKTGTSKKRQKRRQQEASSATSTTTTTPSAAAPRASLTIKTYDPHSGACLKYRTTKAAEVSRLILSLGQLGRKIAALPTDTDAVMADAGAAEEVGTPGVVEKAEGSGGVGTSGAKPPAQAQGQQQGGGGGGKGKKKRAKK